jgi:hypothetical protein
VLFNAPRSELLPPELNAEKEARRTYAHDKNQ